MLENWLKPLQIEDFSLEDAPNYQFGKNIKIYTGQLPDLKDTQIALIGIGEEDANTIRRALYRMSFPFANLKIADLGNMRKSDPAFPIPLLKELIDSQIVPIIVSADSRHILSQYKAFQNLLSHVSLAVIDERIRLDENDKTNEAQYLNDILLNTRSRLYHLSMVGCQTHYTNPAAFNYLEKNTYDCLRLGNARADLAEAEPLIRDADLTVFHLAAIRQADAPGQNEPTPTGFSVDEACQISRYAGMSDKLRAYGIFGFQQALDHRMQTAQVVAQMVWYFIEGFANRKNDFPVSTDGLMEYIVDFKQMDYQLTFWKSQRSSRWWMQVPVKIGKKYHRHRLIPCSYNDYKLACQDELPERLLNAYKRFL